MSSALNPSYVSNLVDHVLRTYGRDRERAHMEEDSLLEDFVEGIACGRVEDVEGCARELCRLIRADRERWYA